MKKVSRENLDALFAAIAEAKKLYLPVADSTDEKRSAKYTVWTPKTKYASEAVNTVRSAKDFFFPQVENMVNFKVNGKKIEVDDIRTECEDFVIFGVRACDAASFKILDSVYLSEPVDTFYQNRREHGVVMTMSCTKPSETCFCSVFGIDAAEPAGDVIPAYAGRCRRRCCGRIQGKDKGNSGKAAAEKSVYRFLRRRQADGTVQLR